MRIPTDSADAQELREVEHERELVDATHDRLCADGWLGEDTDDRPVPCPVCRPHLWPQPCRTCSTAHATCGRRLEQRHRRCCPTCDHPPVPDLATVLARHELGPAA